MDHIVDYLSDYAASLSFGDLPSEVVHHAKRMLIDTLGGAIGGYASEPSTMARALAATISSQQPATELGSGQQTSLELATFANGTMIRYLEFNDGYTSLMMVIRVKSPAILATPLLQSCLQPRWHMGTAGVSSPRPYWRTKCSVASVPRHRGVRRLVSGLLTPEQTSRLLERLWHLEQVQDIGEVIRMVRISA